MPTAYVLIDFENVQPQSLAGVPNDYHVAVLVGPRQESLSIGLVEDLLKLGARADLVRVKHGGNNALDFCLAYLIGRLAAHDPKGNFLIISKDTGFNSLVANLRSQSVRANRYDSLDDIPTAKRTGANGPSTSTEEMVDLIVEKLQKNAKSRPGSVKTLVNSIKALSQNRLNQQQAQAVLKELESRGHITTSGQTLTYNLPIADRPPIAETQKANQGSFDQDIDWDEVPF